MASTRRQPPFNLFNGSRGQEPLDVLHSSSSRSLEGGGPTSGPIADGTGFYAETYPVYQAHQTRSQFLPPHLTAAIVMTTAYWMFQVSSTFLSSALAGSGSRSPQLASVSLSRCQAAHKGVRIVPVEPEYRESRRAEDQETGPVGAPGQWQVRPAGGGAAADEGILPETA